MVVRMTKMNCLLFLPLPVLLIVVISFFSSTIFAEDTDTSHLTGTSSRADENQPYRTNTITEEFLTEAIWFGSVEEVAIATRHETKISKAPGIVTVITTEEIKNLGYRTFVEILRTIPGFEILKDGSNGVVVPSVRGITSSNKVRLMLNGHFVNSPFTGSAFGRFDDFPVENIKKIEIVRGPGSAMYGENAFTAVINIITKDAKDIDGVKVSSGYGSFETYEENVVFGKTYGKVDVSGMLHYRQTGGFDGIVESDRQTILDNTLSSFGVPAVSQATGRVHDGRQEYDVNLKVAYKDFYFEGLYINKNILITI